MSAARVGFGSRPGLLWRHADPARGMGPAEGLRGQGANLARLESACGVGGQESPDGVRVRAHGAGDPEKVRKFER
jgi:hypothetical protein